MNEIPMHQGVIVINTDDVRCGDTGITVGRNEAGALIVRFDSDGQEMAYESADLGVL